MKTKISAYQLFCVTVLIPYGTALLFLITPEAKQDAWIAILIYILPGVVLQIIYTSLWIKYPKDTIVLYMPKIFGKLIGTVISILYIAFFSYITIRVLRDTVYLILITIMPEFSIALISLILIFVAGYAVYVGIENICRLSHFALPLLVLFFILEWIFLFTTPNALKFYHLKPVFENGIFPVIKEGWKLLTFPYGETLLATMLYPSVAEESKVRKAGILAIISLGILLSLSSIMFISVLGIDLASTSLFPLLQTMRIMHIGKAFDRVEIFFILIILLGGVIKISLFMYGSMLGTAQLIKLKDTQPLVIPFSIGIFLASLLIAQNYPQHIYIGLVFSPPYIHLPLLVVIPIVALLVQGIRGLSK